MNEKPSLSKGKKTLVAIGLLLALVALFASNQPRKIDAVWAKDVSLQQDDLKSAGLAAVEDSQVPNWNSLDKIFPGNCDEWARLGRLLKDQTSWSKVAFEDEKKPGGRFRVSQQIIKLENEDQAKKAAELFAAGASNVKCDTVVKYSWMTETYSYSNGSLLSDAFPTGLYGSRMQESRTVDLGFSVSTTESEYIAAQRDSAITIIELRQIQNSDRSDVITMQELEGIAGILLSRFSG
jgi:hypothetical protein